MAMDVARIEERIDRTAAGAVEISSAVGGIHFQTMMEVMEFSKLMSISGAAVPSHLRGNPGACLAISIQALEWKMSPFAVANKSYLVSNKGEERIAYESQLIHAVIEARAPLEGRLRFEIVGEGDERRCKVWGTFRGEREPHVYLSESLGKLRDARGRNEYGKLKGSPLWDSQPEVQIFYSASRQWCRLFAPDVLLGIYAQEELDHVGPDNAKDVSDKPDVASRLKGGKGRGFSAQHVERETSRGVIDESANTQSSAPADAGADQVERTAPLHSSSGSPAPQLASEPDTKPAPEGVEAKTIPDGAGTSQSPDAPAEQRVPSGEKRQATEPGASALHGSSGLPEGLRADWKAPYAAALGRAQKIGSLSKFAAEFWKPLGGYDKIKGTAHYAHAEAIYALFRDYFGEAQREKRDAMLHEMGVGP